LSGCPAGVLAPFWGNPTYKKLVEGRAHSSIKMPFWINCTLSKENIDILKKWVQQRAKTTDHYR